jgi:tyrosinase
MSTKPFANSTRRQIIAGLAAFSVVPAFGIGTANAQSVPKRKNIDALSSTELDNYKHAFDLVKQRSVGNPTRKDGLVYQASLHNKVRAHADPDNPAGACEHGSELFFPWHRAHLSGFEKLLQASDPARTANVTIPYWDWTQKPTGNLFPTAFEDQSSPLFNNGRRKTGDPPMWDPEDIRGMVKEPAWDLFAGRPRIPDSSYGAFEQSPHNSMHPMIGSTMANPSTAANDPIYWSFHAYVDLVWARWQRLHPQIFGCGTCKLWLEPSVFATNEKVTTKDWNYEYDYDFSPDGPAVIAVAGAGSSNPLPMLVAPGDRSASAALNVAPTPARKLLKIEKVLPLADATYRIRVYVHPADLKVAGLSEEQRRQYLVRSITIWQSGGHHPDASDVYVDLTAALAKPDGNPVVSVLTDTAPTGDAGANQPMLDAALPKVQGLFRGLAIEER